MCSPWLKLSLSFVYISSFSSWVMMHDALYQQCDHTSHCCFLFVSCFSCVYIYSAFSEIKGSQSRFVSTFDLHTFTLFFSQPCRQANSCTPRILPPLSFYEFRLLVRYSACVTMSIWVILDWSKVYLSGILNTILKLIEIACKRKILLSKENHWSVVIYFILIRTIFV